MSFQSRYHPAELVAQERVAMRMHLAIVSELCTARLPCQAACSRLRMVYYESTLPRSVLRLCLAKKLAIVLVRCAADLPRQAACCRIRTVYYEPALPTTQVPRGTVDSS